MSEYSRSNYTGRMYEEDYVGRVENTPAYTARLEKLARGRIAKDGGPFVFFEEAVILAKEFQPWEPTEPKKDLTRDLRLTVGQMLQIPNEELDRVRAYTAVGTRLDTLHQVDTFIEVDDHDPKIKQTHRVSIDLTKRPSKAPDGGIVEEASTYTKPHYLVVGELAPPEEDLYLKQVEQIAALVVRHIQDQIERAGEPV